MTGRKVPEWIGSTPDAAIPTRVKLRIFEREGGVCHLTGRKIRAGEAFDYDHVVSLTRGGEHRESNLKPALKQAHRDRSAAENSEDARADRIRAKHLGIWKKSPRPMQSRPFDKFNRGADQ